MLLGPFDWMWCNFIILQFLGGVLGGDSLSIILDIMLVG